MPARVAVIGLDACEPSIALRLIEEGQMPHLAGLLRTGSSAAVETPDGLQVGGVWPTFATGTGVGTHGFYCFRQVVAGQYSVRRFNPYDIALEPFWQQLSTEGARCAVVDAPLARPADINGLQIVDWGTHDRMLDPIGVGAGAAQLMADVGPHPVVGRCDDLSSAARFADLHAALSAGLEKKAMLSRAVLEREPWDLFITVFGETHCAGHQLWGLHDPNWPHHDPRLRSGFDADPLESIYAGADRALGRVVDGLDGDTTLVVLMSHGFGPHIDGDHLLAPILARIEDAICPRPGWRVARERAGRGIRRIGRRLDKGADDTLVSTDGSRAFVQVPNNELYGGVRFNLAGREPRGFVDHGSDSVRDQLTDELLALRCSESGRPLVQRVIDVDTAHPGPKRDALPDLLIEWDRSAEIVGATSPTIGEVKGRYHGVRSGDHRPGGFVVTAGAGVTASTPSGQVRTEDFAPSLAGLIGVDLAGCDGQSRPTLFGDRSS